MKIIPFIFLLCSPCFALAPHPINFNKLDVQVEDKTYEVKFDGNKLTMVEKKPMFGCLFFMTSAFWLSVLAYIGVKFNLLLEILIVLISVGVPLHMLWTYKKPKIEPETLGPVYEVEAEFAFYFEGYDDIPPFPSYIVRKSNHNKFPVGGNVGKDLFIENGFPVPYTPSFEEWVRTGKKITR